VLISIITINFNDVAGLKKTMTSVLDQTYGNIEYIIIDGGSTDGSKEYIETHHESLAYWVSEPDTGIYNAMNKGIDKATGDYLLFLNSGDTFYTESVIADSLKLMQENLDIYYGNVLRHYVNGKKVLKTYPNNLSFSFFIDSSLPHQALYAKRSLFDKIGYFNENYVIAADWEFLTCAICKNNCTYGYLDMIISNFDMSGISNQKIGKEILKREREMTYSKYFSAYMDDYNSSLKEKKFNSENNLYKLKAINGSKTLTRIHAFVLRILYFIYRKKTNNC